MAVTHEAIDGDEIIHGMTTRTWLAGQALAGILASGVVSPETAAAHAVEYAEKLIKILNEA